MGRTPRQGAGERHAHRCTECGWTSARWVGRCGECQTWGSVAATGLSSGPPATLVSPGPVTGRALPIGDVDATGAASTPTGVAEFDRVLGGGLVAGAVVLLAGEPGVGKSTLLLAAAAARAAAGSRVLLVSGEESAAQVRLRAARLGALQPTLFLAAENDVGAVLSHVDDVEPDLLIVDSVQTMTSAAADGTAGGVVQVREVAAAFIRLAKQRGVATVLVGHVTKDGGIAGPRVLEHLVDVVLHFEGDRGSRLRLLRAVKNRYGPADEVGCFDLTDAGLRGLPDPSGLFLSGRSSPVPGTCVTVTAEGRRALVVEVQGLVAPGPAGTPRRATSGLDSQRVAMLLAVLERRAGTSLATSDVYAATVGGVRLADPAADLAVALALASSARGTSCPTQLVCLGEVGLTGEIRPVPGIEHRLAEAARLGFTVALVPVGNVHRQTGLEVVEVADIGAALGVLRPAGVGASAGGVPVRSSLRPLPHAVGGASGR